MAYERKDNSGSIFKNANKTEDWHADARGSALIDGVEYWVDAYTNTGTKNNSDEKWQGLRFKKKDSQPKKESSNEITYDDIPF